MRLVNRRVREAVFLAGLIVMSGSTASCGNRTENNSDSAKPADSSVIPATTALTPPGSPLALPWDIEPTVDAGGRKVRDLVATMGFPARGKEFEVAQKQGPPCKLEISPAPGSQRIQKKKNASAPYGYVAALLSNPNGCDPRGFDLPKDHKAAWIVRFDTPDILENRRSSDRVPELGAAWLVHLANSDSENDTWLPKKNGWTLGQCGHPGEAVGPDNALILKRDNVCEVSLANSHDANKVAAFIASSGMWRAKVQFTAADDPSLWFACGEDCCYSDSR